MTQSDSNTDSDDPNSLNGKPILTPEEFDAALLQSKVLENKIWDLINGEKPSIHAVAMLGGSLAGRIQSVICSTKDDHRAELLALHANVYWSAYHNASKLIPKLLLEMQLSALLDEIGKEEGFENIQTN